MKPAAPSPTPRHRFFSPLRVAALAGVTLTELIRLRVFLFLVIFALALIASPLVFAEFVFRDQFQMLRDVGLGAMSIFSSLLAVLATAGALPRDTEDRTLYTILAKPMSRFEYLCGKFAGIVCLLATALGLMALLFAVVLWARAWSVERETVRIAAANGFGAETVAAQVRELRAAAFSPGLGAATAMIFVKSCLLAAMTLLISTFATSTIFTVIVAVSAYFIGHFQAVARDAWLAAHPGSPAALRFLLGAIVLLFPDLQSFNVLDAAAAGGAIPPALVLEAVGFGAGYCAVYLLAAQFIFSARQL